MENLPKISIRVITYNQEKLLPRALDSVLQQREYVHEIIISDDCSTDNTWGVIQEYYKKYPDIIRPYRNEKNLGIFENIEQSWKYFTGEVIFNLAGDDAFCDGIFKHTIDVIEEEKIDYKNELFTIFMDWKTRSPEGKEKIYTNERVLKHDPLSLKLRYLLTNRSIAVSNNVIKNFFPIPKNVGIFADGLIDIQLQLFTKKYYYKSFVGSIYYTDIGIASRTDTAHRINSKIMVFEEYKKIIPNLSSHDLDWIEYTIALNTLLRDGFSTKRFLKYVKYLFKNLTFRYGFEFFKNQIKSSLALFKRMLFR